VDGLCEVRLLLVGLVAMELQTVSYIREDNNEGAALGDLQVAALLLLGSEGRAIVGGSRVFLGGGGGRHMRGGGGERMSSSHRCCSCRREDGPKTQPRAGSGRAIPLNMLCHFKSMMSYMSVYNFILFHI
jgi:hypothetical protein